MIEYARSDTHHLMDIYHCMKEELLDKGNEQKNLLQAAYSQSNTLCKCKLLFLRRMLTYYGPRIEISGKLCLCRTHLRKNIIIVHK